jgi:tetratricopeptide (TPR) repeat protein
MDKSSKTDRFRKGLVVFLFLCITQLSGYELQILPDKPIVDRVITFKIVTKIESTQGLDVVTDLELPESFSRISGPVRSLYSIREGRRLVRYYQITWAVRGSKTGIFEVPRVSLESNGDLIELEFPLLKIFSLDELSRENPIKVEWQEDIKKNIYIGETIPLIIEAHYLKEIIFPGNILTRDPLGGSLDKVSGLGSIELETIKDLSLYRVSIGSWLFTPMEKGLIVIPSIKVEIDGQTRNTGDLILDVKGFPNENSSRGVGEFIITTNIATKDAILDENLVFKIRVEGMGNLPYLNIPEIGHEGLILINKEEVNSISPSLNGYMGWREIHYTLQPIEEGFMEIKVPSLSWIDSNGRISYYNGQNIPLNVIKTKISQEQLRPYLSLYSPSRILESYRYLIYKIPYLWITSLISTFLYFILALKKTISNRYIKRIRMISVVLASFLLISATTLKRVEIENKLNEANLYIEEGNYQDALDVYSYLELSMSNNFGLFINISILNDKLGNKAAAFYNILAAERINPNLQEIQDIKRYLSGSDDFYTKQVKPAAPINPDYLFLGIITVINFLLYYVLKYKKTKKILSLSVVIFFLIILSLLSISFAYLISKNSKHIGVIKAVEVNVRKVPTELALEWVSLEVGYSVYINSQWEDKFLIETEYGLEGWIEKDSVLVLGDEREL